MSSWFVHTRSMILFVGMLAFAALAVFLASHELLRSQTEIQLLETQAREPVRSGTLRAQKPPESGKFCGGIAGIPCLSGYICKLDGTHPDAGGTCVPTP
jgi:hypothetical protein